MIKAPKQLSNYSVVCNEVARRNDLSARAKGIYYYLATLPSEWELNMTELFTHFTEGKDAIRTAFNELVTIGYISREKKRGQGKFSGYSYEVHWSPCTVSPYAEKPYTVNPPLLSTNKKVITKESKKKIYKKEFTLADAEEIYKAYPLHRGKAKGIEKLMKLKPDEATKKVILSQIGKYKKITDPKYYALFSSWVNQKRWEDDLDVTEKIVSVGV